MNLSLDVDDRDEIYEKVRQKIIDKKYDFNRTVFLKRKLEQILTSKNQFKEALKWYISRKQYNNEKYEDVICFFFELFINKIFKNIKNE